MNAKIFIIGILIAGVSILSATQSPQSAASTTSNTQRESIESTESNIESNTLKVSAKSFQSHLQKGITELKGEVIITKGEDKLYADKVIIHSNHKNQPQKYTATGNVRFFANAQERQMKGRAKKAVYNVAKDEYHLMDNALIEEVNTKNIIKGSTIIFNPKTQQATVQGSKNKPSTMSFVIENGKE